MPKEEIKNSGVTVEDITEKDIQSKSASTTAGKSTRQWVESPSIYNKLVSEQLEEEEKSATAPTPKVELPEDQGPEKESKKEDTKRQGSTIYNITVINVQGGKERPDFFKPNDKQQTSTSTQNLASAPPRSSSAWQGQINAQSAELEAATVFPSGQELLSGVKTFLASAAAGSLGALVKGWANHAYYVPSNVSNVASSTFDWAMTIVSIAVGSYLATCAGLATARKVFGGPVGYVFGGASAYAAWTLSEYINRTHPNAFNEIASGTVIEFAGAFFLFVVIKGAESVYNRHRFFVPVDPEQAKQPNVTSTANPKAPLLIEGNPEDKGSVVPPPRATQ